MKEAVVDLLYSKLSNNLTKEQIEKLIEIPPSDEMGDFAFPCFSLAKMFRKNPAAIAQELRADFEGKGGFEKVEAISGYVNFYIDKKKDGRKCSAKRSFRRFRQADY